MLVLTFEEEVELVATIVSVTVTVITRGLEVTEVDDTEVETEEVEANVLLT